MAALQVLERNQLYKMETWLRGCFPANHPRKTTTAPSFCKGNWSGYSKSKTDSLHLKLNNSYQFITNPTENYCSKQPFSDAMLISWKWE